MSLPIIPLATDTVTLSDGSVVAVRGLSRTKAGRFAAGEFTSKLAEAETFLLVNGADVTEEEAAAWLDSTGPEDAGKVIDRILELSALAIVKSDQEHECPHCGEPVLIKTEAGQVSIVKSEAAPDPQ